MKQGQGMQQGRGMQDGSGLPGQGMRQGGQHRGDGTGDCPVTEG
jgi:hypothetical protein